MATLKDQWEMFSMLCVPADAGLEQRKQMKQSFYAGMAAMLSLQDKAILSPDVTPDKFGVMMMGWHVEVSIFAKGITA